MRQTHYRENNLIKQRISKTFLDTALEHNAFVAGGPIRSLFTSEASKDIDIFFATKQDFTVCCESWSGKQDSPTFTTTDTAWTHNDGETTYQLICCLFGTPEEVIKAFDFTCCMGAWIPKTNEFELDPLFLKHCSQRRLVFNPNAKFPICSLWRAVKFIRRGWRLPAVESIKLSLAIHHLQIQDRTELKRQLLGIDTLFLKEMTDALEVNGNLPYDYMEAVDFIMDFMEKQEDDPK